MMGKIKFTILSFDTLVPRTQDERGPKQKSYVGKASRLIMSGKMPDLQAAFNGPKTKKTVCVVTNGFLIFYVSRLTSHVSRLTPSQFQPECWMLKSSTVLSSALGAGF
jgi:hypothetical protein